MALVLRACIAGQRRCCFGELKALQRSTACAGHAESVVERFAPVAQLRRYSTNADTEADERQEVYTGLLARAIRNLKIFSLTSSGGALIMQPMIVSQAIAGDNMLALLGASGMFTFFAIGMPLLINMVTKRYATHVFYHPKEDKYTYRRYTLFLRTKEVQFRPEDVMVPIVNGYFSTCVVKDEPLFLDERYFTDVSHFMKIMGYDKPLDYKLNQVLNDVEKDSKRKETENV